MAEALARDGRLTAPAVKMLVEPGMAELYLPGASSVLFVVSLFLHEEARETLGVLVGDCA